MIDICMGKYSLISYKSRAFPEFNMKYNIELSFDKLNISIVKQMISL